MSWFSVAPTPIVIADEGYYEFRETSELSGEPTLEKRRRQTASIEYRGMTLTCALTLCAAAVYTNGTRSYTMRPIGGGGYNVVWTYDIVIGGWEEGESPYS